MKKMIIRMVLVTLLLAVGSAAPVLTDGGGGFPPLCYPNPCPNA